MVQILTYEQIDRIAWAELVRMSRTGTWFQSPEAYDFFCSLPNIFEPFVVAISDERLGIKGICSGYVTKESNALKQFFTRRAIILGGPALADDCTAEEVSVLMKTVHEHLSSSHSLIRSFNHFFTRPIFIETRNFNDYNPWRAAFEAVGFAYQSHLNFHVKTEGFEERLSDNRKRQVRKVMNEGVTELMNNDGVIEQDIREWYEVLKQLYRTKVKTPLFPIEFFLEAYHCKIGHFVFVKHAGHVIGGSMMVQDNQCVYEWFECGMNTEFRDQYPSVMATYSGIKYAQQQGCYRYDMMGAGKPNIPYGVRDFKSEFGGTLVEHGRFLCVCQPFFYHLGKLAVKMLKIRCKN